jgi:hypothetical protein
MQAKMNNIINNKRARVPNLYIIGAAKSATTTLWANLVQHPEIYRSANKEPMLFLQRNDILANYNYWRNEKYAVDATVLYSKTHRHKEIPEQIFKAYPESKLIYVIREPFSRIISEHKYFTCKGENQDSLLNTCSR